MESKQTNTTKRVYWAYVLSKLQNHSFNTEHGHAWDRLLEIVAEDIPDYAPEVQTVVRLRKRERETDRHARMKRLAVPVLGH